MLSKKLIKRLLDFSWILHIYSTKISMENFIYNVYTIILYTAKFSCYYSTETALIQLTKIGFSQST